MTKKKIDPFIRTIRAVCGFIAYDSKLSINEKNELFDELRDDMFYTENYETYGEIIKEYELEVNFNNNLCPLCNSELSTITVSEEHSELPEKKKELRYVKYCHNCGYTEGE